MPTALGACPDPPMLPATPNSLALGQVSGGHSSRVFYPYTTVETHSGDNTVGPSHGYSELFRASVISLEEKGEVKERVKKWRSVPPFSPPRLAP